MKNFNKLLFFSFLPKLYYISFFIAAFGFHYNVFGQTVTNSANLDQVRNGRISNPEVIGQWENGNLNGSQAHYSEGWSVPYRIIMANLSAGTHQITIEWDTKDNGKHALDYITHYDNMDYPVDSHLGFGHSQEIIDPTVGVPGLGIPNYFPIPAPSSAGASVPGQPTASFNALPPNKRLMTIYNGTITSMSYAVQESLVGNHTKSSMVITFTNNTASNVVLAWGGHIAAEYDWGLGEGATAINGSPYHTRLIDLDGSGGNQDRSLKTDAVFIPVRCDIAGPVETCPSANPLVYSSTILNPNNSAVTYNWELINNTANASISGSNTGSSINVVPASGQFTAGGSFNVKLTVTREGISHVCYLGSDTNPGNIVRVLRCNPEVICTYTLDFYGNEPETACGVEGNQIATVATMTSAMNNAGGTKVFGLASNNRTFTLSLADISVGGNIFTMLPGTSGTSAALTDNSSYSGVPIDNPLLAHTMVLFFNLNVSASLGTLDLTNNMWTQQVDCATGQLIPNTNLLTQMPESVVSYLFNSNNGYPQNVAGLFALANDALGGKNLGDPNLIVIPSFDDLKTAVERINAAFNECRRLVPANINATGFIYNDDDGMEDGKIDFVPGSPLNGPALGGVYLTLIEGADFDADGANIGNILKVSPIDANGNYLFDPVVNGTYTINMGTTPTGDRKPKAPAGKVFTAEGGNVINGFATGDGTPNGRIVMYVEDNNPPVFQNLRAAAPAATLNDLNYGIGNASLPVKLEKFEAKKQNEANILHWKTSNEINFSHFEIQKSADSKQFENIAKIVAINEQSEKNEYSYRDDKAATEAYYRLKLVDLNGSFNYSKMVFVDGEKSAMEAANIYPNPALGNQAEMQIESKSTTNWTISYLDYSGKVLRSEQKNTAAGRTILKLNLEKLPAGEYLIKIENGNESYLKKLLKK